MKKLNTSIIRIFFLVFFISLIAYSCKKDDNTNPANTQFVNLEGTTWKFYNSYLGYPPYVSYYKFNSNNKFDYAEQPSDNPTVYYGTWTQNLNSFTTDFEYLYHQHYAGNLINADSISGTMVDSTISTAGVFTAQRVN